VVENSIDILTISTIICHGDAFGDHSATSGARLGIDGTDQIVLLPGTSLVAMLRKKFSTMRNQSGYGTQGQLDEDSMIRPAVVQNDAAGGADFMNWYVA
jgi:hypothetical protein